MRICVEQREKHNQPNFYEHQRKFHHSEGFLPLPYSQLRMKIQTKSRLGTLRKSSALGFIIFFLDLVLWQNKQTE